MNQTATVTEELWDKELLAFPKDSRAWVYQITGHQPSVDELLSIKQKVKDFAASWQVHGSPAKAYGDLLFGKFILFVVSSETPASGCSIDSSVRFLQQLEKEFSLDLFNRVVITYAHPETGQLREIEMKKAKARLKTGEINSHAYMFNNTITTLAQLDGEWILPFEKSWLMP